VSADPAGKKGDAVAGLPSLRDLTAPFAAKPGFFQLLLLLLAVYGGVFVQLFRAEWGTPESSHGPIVLALALWLVYLRWDQRNVAPRVAAARAAGVFALFALAATLFVVGVVGEVSQIAYGSIVPFLVAGILLLQNRRAGIAFLFPVCFVLFSIPLPGFIVDPITLPMKLLVAAATEKVLHFAGYPTARSGVIIYLGQYQLQVADACAGLRTLFTLEALGLLYLNIVAYGSLLRNVGLALLVVPISMISNIVRVVLLCLITYHFGDGAGQGFLHEFAGIVLFLCALMLLIGTDKLLRILSRRQPAVPPATAP
jgi:exosortase B